MVTMDELYGDGSDHEACEGCGTCLECDGCACEDIVTRALENADEPLSHDEVASQLYMEADRVGEVLSDLVVENKASVNSKREYRIL